MTRTKTLLHRFNFDTSISSLAFGVISCSYHRLLADPGNTFLVAPLKRVRSMCTEEFVYLRARSDRPIKITLINAQQAAAYYDAEKSKGAYASIDAIVGVGATWNVVDGGTGGAQADGFTSYKAQVGNPPRTRWGDYGAIAVDGNSIWIASEYIAKSCDYTKWGGPFFAGGTGDNLLGTCADVVGGVPGPGTRAALGNWSTRISKYTP
jgi:hypothetical protein